MVKTKLPQSVAPWKSAHQDIRGLFQRFVTELSDLKDQIADLNDAELTDLGFLCREIATVADEVRKEFKAKLELIGLHLAKRVVDHSLQDPTDDGIRRGMLASASPKVEHEPVIPYKGTKEYLQLCEWMGLRADIAERGIMSFSFKRMAEMLTEMAEQGKNPPANLVEIRPKFSTTFRRKRGT